MHEILNGTYVGCTGNCGELVRTEDPGVIRQLRLIGDDEWWHGKCWSEAQMKRPRNKALSN